MAVGVSDWADTGAWVQSARSSAAARPARDATASDRTDSQSHTHFGEALSAARSREAAESRTARAVASDARAEVTSRETGAAERTAGDPTPAARRGDDTAAGRGKPAQASQSAARREPADDTARSDSNAAKTTAGTAAGRSDTSAKDTAKAGDAKTEDAKAGDAKAGDKTAEPASGPNAAATGQAAAITPQQPSLAALFAALARGGTVAADPDGLGTAAAAGGAIQGAAAAGGTSPGEAAVTGATASAPVAQGSSGQPQAASIADGAAVAEAVHAKPQPGVSEAAAKPDFLSALSDASQDAAQAAGQNPVTAAPASAAPGTTHAASSTAPAAPTPAAAQTAPPIQIGQVPVTIGLRALQGSNEFQIRLDPAELGRIEVKLEIDKARGTVMTHLVVDRPETMAMLQRDAGQLQQALSQAGLDASGGVGVSLRGDGGAQTGSQSGGENQSRGGNAWTADTTDTVPEAAPMRALRGIGGLDIRI